LRLSSRVVIFLSDIFIFTLLFLSLYIKTIFFRKCHRVLQKKPSVWRLFYKRLLRTDLCGSQPHSRLLGLFAEEETEKREDEEHSEVCNYYACACREIVGIVGYRYTDNVADAGNNRRADRYTAEASEYSH
jgi:hypothetical protein